VEKENLAQAVLSIDIKYILKPGRSPVDSVSYEHPVCEGGVT
jgi:hypothetical protein